MSDPWSGPGPVPRTAFKAVGGATAAPGRFDSFAAPSPLVLGTGGHIDHGKTALVGALTGTDTDRLPEEHERGISIALGYARLVLPSGRWLSVIDVPGHERFVRTMVAGATGIDCFLLAIAADDGVMPQTIEHAEVFRGLGVRHGVVAITKSDRADPAAAAAQATALLPGCTAVACSARTGAGLPALRQALEELAAVVPSRGAPSVDPRPDAAPAPPVLHVDRAFTVAGRGAVVTGTLGAGTLRLGDAVELLPGARPVRVRGLQVHGESHPAVVAGQRVAVALAGIRAREVQRGDVLAGPGAREERLILDCRLALHGARHGERVHVHHGARESPARLAHLGEELYQLRLARPLMAADGDHVIVRRPAPPATLGGGVVLDAAARRHGRRPDLLERLRRRRDGLPDAPPEDPGGARAARRASDEPPAPPVPPQAPAPSPTATAAVDRRLREAGADLISGAVIEDRDALAALVAAGDAVRLGPRLYGHRATVEDACAQIVALIRATGPTSLAEARDALGVSRKSAQALLEHLDAQRRTLRRPDQRRVLSRRAAAEDAP